MEAKTADAFFRSYEESFNEGLAGRDVSDKVVRSFADCFVESSPVGVICGKNSDDFPEKIRQGFEFYRSIGTQSMRILSKQVMTLDEFHALVKVGWRYTAASEDRGPVTIDFEVHYLLRAVKDLPKIFAYITGDEQKVLKDHGLLPDA